MKTKLILSALAIIAVAAIGTPAGAQTDEQPGNGFGVGGFLDENGDGFNDLAPDSDGDGIPNGLDPDYVPAGDGSGNRFGAGNGDGDGVCDNVDGLGEMLKALGGNGNSYGPGDGTGFGGFGPGDGTGFGPGDGTGDCTDTGAGTGSAGANAARGRR